MEQSKDIKSELDSNSHSIDRLENEDDFQYKLRLCIGKLNKEIDLSWNEIVKLLGLNISDSHLRKMAYGYKEYEEYLRNKPSKSDSFKTNYKATIELNKDGSQTSDKLIQMSENDCKDADFLLKAHGYDSKKFELVSARNNIWNSYSKQDGIMTLYSSKITVKPLSDRMSDEEIKDMFKNFDREFKTVKNINYSHKGGKLLFEFPFVDIHYGKKGYLFEVGRETSSDITEHNFFKVISDYKERIKNKPISRIVFPIGNDFFNSDLTNNSTNKGTSQDNDVRWKEMFKKGFEMIIKGIDILSEIAPVDLVYVEGNHDTITAYHLFIALKAYYRNDDSVNVIADNGMTRQYYQWGKCLIGYSHGDCEGKRINGLMQSEQPKMWGNTLYREWHLGHLHHEISQEENGVTIRHLPSITGLDAWHYKNGFTSALQRCQAFIWDKEKGLQDILYSII